MGRAYGKQSTVFVVIGFPSDQFAQEPLNGEQIQEHCQVNYGVTFPMMAKSKVRGDEANAVFKFFSSKSLNGKFSKQPRWNFYKFLVGRNGEALDYFWTYRKPNNAALRKAIERALMATNPKSTRLFLSDETGYSFLWCAS